jgi:hypothetical protein
MNDQWEVGCSMDNNIPKMKVPSPSNISTRSRAAVDMDYCERLENNGVHDSVKVLISAVTNSWMQKYAKIEVRQR